MFRQKSLVTFALFSVLVASTAAACGGAGPSASPTPTTTPTQSAAPIVTSAPTTPAAQTQTPAPPPSVNPTPTSPPQSATPVVTATPTGPPPSTGPATLDAPDSIAAGTPFQVPWTGSNNPGDYVTIVASGTTRWTGEPYFYTTVGSPGQLVAPTTPGEYELWYVNGADSAIIARRPITVTDFVGTLSGPDSVAAGTAFSVEWTGPAAPNDYVTIVAAGTERWTNESYFYTRVGSPGPLIAPIVDGDYELWYVAAADETTMARRPIAVSPLAVTLDAPASVDAGTRFKVRWTGPDGPNDYITIVPADSPPGTYASYAYTASGSPARLTAPDTAGAYEIRYQSDRVEGTFESIPIEVN